MTRINRKWFEKDISGCSLTGFICEDGKRVSGETIIRSIASMNERSNGLGGGFAGYGIYPEMKEFYAFHIMFDDGGAKEETEKILNESLIIELQEKIPTRKAKGIHNPPLLMRYFAKVDENRLFEREISEEDHIIETVMKINTSVRGAYVFSSGKNMGAFKALGFPDEVGRFYRLEEYEGYIWIGHGRFPTNTPGWWGGAHPFTLLDFAVVHNGEISSYGINKRYLEMFGYRCTLMTDTEVMAYLFDLLLRRHRLPVEIACMALAPPAWREIDYRDGDMELAKAIRITYGGALVNGPFAILLGHKKGLIGLNDRLKLRPLVAARKENTLYIASEESGIREICPFPDRVWAPKAGEPVMGWLKEEYSSEFELPRTRVPDREKPKSVYSVSGVC
jgi:glutamate synthase domain-containing protein 1